MDAPLSDRCAEPEGRGADIAAPLHRGLQGGLQRLQSCVPAEEQSQSHLTAHSPSGGPLPGGTPTPTALLENSRGER